MKRAMLSDSALDLAICAMVNGSLSGTKSSCDARRGVVFGARTKRRARSEK
jgi:hypothetical protein